MESKETMKIIIQNSWIKKKKLPVQVLARLLTVLKIKVKSKICKNLWNSKKQWRKNSLKWLNLEKLLPVGFLPVSTSTGLINKTIHGI